jgi:NAD-dependent deacetylase
MGNVCVFTGAGMSTASGLPDFRSGANSLWGKNPESLASVDCMMNNYEDFKAFYEMRLKGLAEVTPNAGHVILADWEKRGNVSCIITQNVDGLHQAAGSNHVAAIHGNLRKISCVRCGKEYSIDDFINSSPCECGGRLRPGVVLFGESLPSEEYDASYRWVEECSTLLVLGSSLQVCPANSFPRQAKRNSACVLIVNRDPTPFDQLADVVVRDPIVEYLEATEQELAKTAQLSSS